MKQSLIYQIDSFTHEQFKGNPAAVCLLDGPRDAQWMQQMGTEMNLSETAFVWKVGSDYSLKWFTPTIEVRLCGHATLAALCAMKDAGWIKTGERVKFSTRSGILEGEVKADSWIERKFPSELASDCGLPEQMLSALQANFKPTYVGKN